MGIAPKVRCRWNGLSIAGLRRPDLGALTVLESPFGRFLVLQTHLFRRFLLRLEFSRPTPLQVFVVEAGSKSIMLRFSVASIVCCSGGEVLGLLQELSTKSASLKKMVT